MARRPGLVELLTPAPTYSDAERLVYPKLAPAIDEFYEDEFDALEESEKQVDENGERLDPTPLTYRHLAMIAMKLQQVKNNEARLFWGRSFTGLSAKLYGQPDGEEALGLAREDAEALHSLSSIRQHIGHSAVASTLRLYEQLHTASANAPSVTHEDDAQVHAATRQYLEHKFRHVYQEMDDLDDTDILSPKDTYRYFERMLTRLQDDDSRWSNWNIVPKDTAQMAVLPSAEEIRIGTSMSSLTAKHAKGLFTHEVIWHGGRAVNGRAYGKRMATGLPGYRKIEEGGGVFIEGAIEDEMPARIRDRYIDIALAQGLSALEPIGRHELFDIAYGRMILRRSSENLPPEDDLVRRSCWQHVNRIYLGTPGDKANSGVFTRNVFYYEGYRGYAYHVKQYPVQYLPQVLQFDMSAKINPLEATQRRYLHDQITGRGHGS